MPSLAAPKIGKAKKKIYSQKFGEKKRVESKLRPLHGPKDVVYMQC